MNDVVPFLVQWSEGPAERRLQWWLKGIQPNRYVGEIIDYARHLQIGLEGFFAEGDLATLTQLIQEMRERRGQEPANSTSDGYALLALGTRAKPDILFRYSNGCEPTNDSARLFLRIVDTLRKYVEPSLDSAKSA